MRHDEWYNIYRHNFYYIGHIDEGEKEGDFDGRPISQYGDTIVDDLFDLQKDDIETEASVAAIIWMQVAHYLEAAAEKCQLSQINSSLDGLEELDLAAAYWIGWGQEEGDNSSGHLMYNLAENAGERFGKDAGEAEVNTKIIDLMNKIQTEIIIAGKCPTDYLMFRSLVKKIISYMTVPLIQNLIHSMSEKDGGKLVLYGLTLLPQIATCDPDAYDYFRDKLLIQTYIPANFNAIIARLQSLFPCFGITCADVGAYKTDELPQCDDSAGSINALAGFPLTNDIQEVGP